MHISLKEYFLKRNGTVFLDYGTAVYDEISNWEKLNVKDAFKARSGAKQALCY